MGLCCCKYCKKVFKRECKYGKVCAECRDKHTQHRRDMIKSRNRMIEAGLLEKRKSWFTILSSMRIK